MNTIYHNCKCWALMLCLLTGLPFTGIAQTELFEMVVEKTDGTEIVFRITDDYPVLQYIYGGEDGVNTLKVQTVNGETYIPCPDVKRLFTRVAENIPEPSTVTAKSYTREYGEENPAFEYTVEGGELSGTPSITCDAIATSPVGVYTIIIAQGDVVNENVTYVNGTLTITKAPLTITAKSYTITQGDALPTFDVEYSGFKNDETADILNKKPVLTTSVTSSSEPGTFGIVVSGAEAQNYAISYVNGILTIVASQTGISQIMSAENGDVMIFTIDGRRVDNLKKGMNIIRMSDGTTRKVVVK